MNYSGYAYLVGYMLLYFAVVGGVWIWRHKTRQNRPPVPDKVARTAGESLRQKIERFDDTLLFHLVGSALVPLLVMIAGLWFIASLSPAAHTWSLVGLCVILAGVLYGSTWWLIKILGQRRDDALNYFGKRVVGDALEGLRAQGYYVFHDVPAHEASPTFCIDHVVVGPTGVFVMETLTRRRGVARAGLDEHRIVFDGQQIIYPWGEDFVGLNTARDRGDWLNHWLVQILGSRVPVLPMLVFPGWWVEERTISTVRVVNPNQISPVLLRSAQRLPEDQIQTIVRQLEARCRDVTF